MEEGGALLARISDEFVRIQKQYWGLGPVKAKSYMMDDLLLIVMRGGLTRAEQTMLDFDEEDLVRSFLVAELFVFDRAAPGSREIVANTRGQLDKEPRGETGESTEAAPTGEAGTTPGTDGD